MKTWEDMLCCQLHTTMCLHDFNSQLMEIKGCLSPVCVFCKGSTVTLMDNLLKSRCCPRNVSQPCSDKKDSVWVAQTQSQGSWALAAESATWLQGAWCQPQRLSLRSYHFGTKVEAICHPDLNCSLSLHSNYNPYSWTNLFSVLLQSSSIWLHGISTSSFTQLM